MGKVLGSLALIGATIATAGAAAPFISGAIVGIGGGTFAALGVSAVLTPALSLAAGAFVGSTLSGIIMGSPSLPKPDTTSTALKTSRPPRVSAYGICRLYGAYILFETAANGRAIDVYVIHDGELTETVRFYLADDAVNLSGNTVLAGSDGRYGDSRMQLFWTDGSSPGTPFSAVMSELPGIWTANHRGDGVVLLSTISRSVKSENFLDIYPNGVPVASMVAKWQKCPDLWADDPTDDSQWTWTENVIRHLAHYKLVREGVDYATKIAPTIDYWRAAQDVCNEDVPLKAGGTEKRWRSCLSHTHTQKHGDVTAALLATCDGWIAPRADGALVVYAGKYYEPTISIGPKHITAYEWAGVGVDDDSAVNSITCSYVSAAHDYNTVECDAWIDEDDILARGQELTDSLDPQVPSHGQVRRLAKRMMQRTNALYRGTVTTNVAGRIARGQRYINLHIEEAGTVFFSGVAEITAVTRNMQTGGITFSWVAANPNIDAWNPATEEGSPAATGDRVAPQPLAAPEIDSATPELSSDGVTAQIRLIVDGPDRDDLTWFARWKLSSDSIWNESVYNDIDAGDTVELLTTLVPTNANIDIAVSYQVGDGRVAPWSATETVSTSTSALAPLPPSDFTATGSVGEVALSWRNPSSAFAHIRVYRGATADFGSASLISGDIVGGLGEVMSLDDTSLSAGTYYYWVRSFNVSAVGSSPVGPEEAIVT